MVEPTSSVRRAVTRDGSAAPVTSAHVGLLRRGRLSVVVILTALVVLASACGGSATDSEQALDSDNATTGGSDAATESGSDSDDAESGGIGPPRSVFPDVEVVEINSGQAVNVADELAGSGKATLLWFFAPH